MVLCWFVENSLVHWYQQCVTVHYVPKCMNCHRAIVVITKGANGFHDCIYITLILLLWDLNTMCRGSLMTMYLHTHTYIYIYIYIYIHTQAYTYIEYIFAHTLIQTDRQTQTHRQTDGRTYIHTNSCYKC